MPPPPRPGPTLPNLPHMPTRGEVVGPPVPTLDAISEKLSWLYHQRETLLSVKPPEYKNQLAFLDSEIAKNVDKAGQAVEGGHAMIAARQAYRENGDSIIADLELYPVKFVLFESGMYGCSYCHSVWCAHFKDTYANTQASNQLLNWLLSSHDKKHPFIFIHDETSYVKMIPTFLDRAGVGQDLVTFRYLTQDEDFPRGRSTTFDRPLDGYIDPMTDTMLTISRMLENDLNGWCIDTVTCNSKSHFRAKNPDPVIRTLEDAFAWIKSAKCSSCERYHSLVMDDDLIPAKESNWRKSK